MCNQGAITKISPVKKLDTQFKTKYWYNEKNRHNLLLHTSQKLQNCLRKAGKIKSNKQLLSKHPTIFRNLP